MEPGVELIEQFIVAVGYPGVAMLMALDATILPVPSAAVMGFAGYACYTGEMNIAIVTLVGAVGSTAGSMLMYALTRWGGRPFLDRYGRYLGLKADRLSRAEAWFERYGDRAVLVSQLFPVVTVSETTGFGSRTNLEMSITISCSFCAVPSPSKSTLNMISYR